MAQLVESPWGRVEFPDGMSPEEMGAAMSQFESQQTQMQQFNQLAPLARDLMRTFTPEATPNMWPQMPSSRALVGMKGEDIRGLAQMGQQQVAATAEQQMRERVERDKALEQEKDRQQQLKLEQMKFKNQQAEMKMRMEQREAELRQRAEQDEAKRVAAQEDRMALEEYRQNRQTERSTMLAGMRGSGRGGGGGGGNVSWQLKNIDGYAVWVHPRTLEQKPILRDDGTPVPYSKAKEDEEKPPTPSAAYRDLSAYAGLVEKGAAWQARQAALAIGEDIDIAQMARWIMARDKKDLGKGDYGIDVGIELMEAGYTAEEVQDLLERNGADIDPRRMWNIVSYFTSPPHMSTYEVDPKVSAPAPAPPVAVQPQAQDGGVATLPAEALAEAQALGVTPGPDGTIPLSDGTRAAWVNGTWEAIQ